MESANKSSRLAMAVLAILLTSFLFGFGNGLNPWWPLLWFAPLPVLIFALNSTWRSTAIVAASSMLIGGLNLWAYLRLLGSPPIVWIVLFSIMSLVFALAVLLFRALVRRGAYWSALVAFPAIWVSFEYARNLYTPHGTGGSFAYSQLHFLPFLQLASITGPWGMTFFLMLFPTAVALVPHLRTAAPRQARNIAVIAFGTLGTVLIFGIVRLAIPGDGKTMRVGLIASDANGNSQIAKRGAAAEQLFSGYAREAEKLAARGAQVIVLPEKLGVVVDSTIQNSDLIFQSLADKTKTTVVAGVLHIAGPLQYNQARVYAPSASLLTYDKHHLLPPFESDQEPGKTITLLTGFPNTTGVEICKDMDFTPLSRSYGLAGAGLILAPAWDFNIDRAWHGHMAIMRGVENGFSIVRAAKNGYLTVTDNRGRILAETRSDSAPFAALLADVPVTHDATLFSLLGDWFAWLSIALLALAIAQLFRTPRSHASIP